MTIQERTDLYPSRIYDEPRILKRPDPVVWGTNTDGPLAADAVQQFDRDGYLFFEGMFSGAELAAFGQELDRLAKSDVVRNSDEAIFEPGSGEVRSIFDIHKISRLFKALSTDERIVNKLAQLLDSQLYIHQSRINFKPGFKGEPFQWHSDFETWHVEDGLPRMRTISCSILLTPNNQFNGPLMVVPRSQRQYVSCVGKTGADNYKGSLKKQEIGVPDTESLIRLVDDGGIVAPVGPAGSVLFFDCNLMHGSSGNMSPWPRSNIFFVYNSVKNQPEDPFCGLKPRPEFIAARREIEPITPTRPDYTQLR